MDRHPEVGFGLALNLRDLEVCVQRAANTEVGDALGDGGGANDNGNGHTPGLGNGQDITLTQSHCQGVWKSGQDSQCFAAWDGAGPYTITDNFLEAASENVLFGGADSSSAANIPADIRIERNLFTKDLAWKGQSRQVKNLLELKAAKRVIIRDNVFERSWTEGQVGRAVLFTRTKHTAKRLAKQLTAAGIPAVDLHGNLSQNARERNLAAFSSGEVRVLTATDIAARGIHVDDVELVVHVDPPTEHKAYLHRSGRTARAGAAGSVVTLVTPEQRRDVAAMVRLAKVTATTLAVRAGSEELRRLVGPQAPKVEQAATPKAAPAGTGQSRGGRGSGRPRPSGAGAQRAGRDGASAAAEADRPRGRRRSRGRGRGRTA